MDEKLFTIIFFVNVAIIIVCLAGILICRVIDNYEEKKYGSLEEGLKCTEEETHKEVDENAN